MEDDISGPEQITVQRIRGALKVMSGKGSVVAVAAELGVTPADVRAWTQVLCLLCSTPPGTATGATPAEAPEETPGAATGETPGAATGAVRRRRRAGVATNELRRRPTDLSGADRG